MEKRFISTTQSRVGKWNGTFLVNTYFPLRSPLLYSNIPQICCCCIYEILRMWVSLKQKQCCDIYVSVLIAPGFTAAMTSLSRKPIIIMFSTNDNKLGGWLHLHITQTIIPKSRETFELVANFQKLKSPIFEIG